MGMITRKRVKISLLCFLLCVSLVSGTACGSRKDGGEQQKEKEAQQGETEKQQSESEEQQKETEEQAQTGEEQQAEEQGDSTDVVHNAGPDGEVKIKKKPELMSKLSTVQFVHGMSASPAWNLGDSLDVCAADRDGDGVVNETPADGIVDETLWGNVRTTKEMIQALREDGIASIRIPVTWRDHMGEGPDYKIDGDWMDRVQEVVDYARECDMYVILNLHHDGGGDPDFGAWIRNASYDKKTVLKRYKAVWKQIAERFKNYSDALIFESMNEVGFDDLPADEAYALLNEFNQVFVDLVRKTGGNNLHRNLLIAGYWTDVEKSCQGGFQMPKDKMNKCILSVHYYTPWEFCTTNMQYTWGTDAELAQMDAKFELLENSYIKKGIPVIIGEFGTGLGNETESRLRFCSRLVKKSRQLGIPAFFWDNGGEFDRSSLQWRTEGLMEGMKKACKTKMKKYVMRQI